MGIFNDFDNGAMSQLGSPMTDRELIWMGQSKKDVVAFSEPVREEVGYALSVALDGGKARSAKPLRGFPGASVFEIVASHDGDTFRVMYTVSVPNAICVLHAFKKKSKQGIKTPQHEINVVRQRLKAAETIR